MELRQIRYFAAVAQGLHFGHASQRLGIAQPALTRQIQSLERELGVDLFDRSRRRVRLTEAGKTFLSQGLQLLERADQLPELARLAARGEVGTLRVSFVGSATYGPMTAALRTFRSQFPRVHLYLHEMDAAAQRRAILDRQIDICLLRVPLRDSELKFETILTEPIIVALPARHRLIKLKTVTIADLADEPFVLFPHSRESSFADVVDAACLTAGFRPRAAQETAEMQTAISLVSAGFGVCMVPLMVQDLRRSGVVYRPLSPPAPTTQLVAGYHADDQTPTVRAFVDTLLKTVSAGG